MQIEKLSLNLRERNGWEAIDLGFAFARQHAASLFPAFAITFLPFVLIAAVAALYFPIWSHLFIWWFLPMFERVALAVLAPAAFGDAPTWRQAIQNLGQIPRVGLIRQLTTRRFFDWGRSFHLPVFQLEGQTGSDANQRIAILHARWSAYSTGLTFVFQNFSLVLYFGTISLIKMLLPGGIGDRPWFTYFSGFNLPSDQLQWSEAIYVLILGSVICILQPFYVAAGFTLYLNRRTQLEGWDLELAFKRLNARHQKSAVLTSTSPVVKTCIGFCISAAIACCLLGVTPQSWAQSPADNAVVASAPTASTPVPSVLAASAPATAATARSSEVLPKPSTRPHPAKVAIDQVLKSPEFDGYELKKSWRLKKQGENPAEKPASKQSGFAEKITEILGAFAQLIRVLLWIAAIAIGIWLVVLLSKRMGLMNWQSSDRPMRSGTLFGLDIRPESLPSDIPASALNLLTQGQIRAALSLLYRGALSTLITRDHLDFDIGDTEGECIARVAKSNQTNIKLAAYFRALVIAWQQCAYAKNMPSTQVVQALANEWAEHFDRRNNSVNPSTAQVQL